MHRDHYLLALVLSVPLAVPIQALPQGPSRAQALVPPEERGPAFVQGPTLLPGPDPNTPLVAVLELVASVPVLVRLNIDDGATERWITPRTAYKTQHKLPVLGLHPDRLHSILVEIRDQSGARTRTSAPLAFLTPPLPADFPPLHTTVALTPSMEPGVTLFGASGSGTGGSRSYVLILDEHGEVIWFHRPPDQVGDLRQLRNGNLLYIHGDAGLREIDLLGNEQAQWWASNLDPAAPPGAIPLPIDTLHHEVYELPEGYAGDFMALSTELRVLPDYPASELDPTQTVPFANVVGDVVVEFQRDGTIVREWRLLDILDPYRVSYDSLGGFWNSAYGLTTADWSHGNAVIPSPFDDSFIVCLRHQDALVKIDGATGALDWILGDPGRWFLPWASALLDLKGESSTWSYHAHSPMITAEGRLLLFDNGVYRAIPPDPQLPVGSRTSRAVEYAINPVDRTAGESWSYTGASPFYSSIVGDADQLARTGNVLITSGAEELGTQRYARVFEVRRAGPTVFEVLVRDDVGSPPSSWIVYRAERIPRLYPQSHLEADEPTTVKL